MNARDLYAALNQTDPNEEIASGFAGGREPGKAEAALKSFVQAVKNPRETAAKVGQSMLDSAARAQALQERTFGDPNRPFKVTDPQAMREYTDMMMAGPLGMANLGVTAYHGSGNLFSRFDPSKRGTGEGAQQYGVGAGYTAEARPVGEGYRMQIASREGKEATIGGKSLGAVFNQVYDKANRLPPDLAKSEYDKASLIEMMMLDKSPAEILSYAKDIGYPKEVLKWFETEIVPKANIPGYLYKGDIPDEIVPSFLDWDKPLSQQTEVVKKLLGKDPLVQESGSPQNWKEASGGIIQKKDEGPAEALSGGELYKYISLKLKSDQAASDYLDKLGLRGIRYLDQGSRVEGKGTSNYVPFRSEDYRVEEINDLPLEEWIKKGLIKERSRGSPPEGEVTNDDYIQQMMTGTPPSDRTTNPGLLPPELRQAVDVPLDFLNLLVRGGAGAVAGPAYGVYKGITSDKFGTPEGVQEASSEAGKMMQKITGEPKTQAARDTLEFIGGVAEEAKVPPMPQFLTTRAPGPGSARALMRSYEFAETPPEGAVKPRGGLFVGPEKEGSAIGKYFKRTKEGLEKLVDNDQLDPDRAKTIQAFIEKQGKKYLTTVYGTAFDPVREAMLDGRLPLMGEDRGTFKSYLMEGLKSKKRDVASESRSDFEKLYDQSTGITSFGYSATDDIYPSQNKRKDLQRQKMEEEIKRLKPGEGLEDFAINPAYSPSADTGNLKREYAPQYQKDLAALIEATPGDQKSTVTDPLARGLLEGETVYDVQPYGLDAFNAQNVAQALSALTDDELKRRDFPEALIEGSRRVRFEREWEDVLDRAANNKPIPKDLFDIGVEEKLKMGDDRWVRVMTKPAVRLEGKAQHHSIGGYGTLKSYNLGGIKAFDSGLAQVFSLRGPDGYPRVTVEAKQLADGRLDITQIKGTYNGLPPPGDQQMTLDFLKSLPINDVVRQESYGVDTNNNRLPDRVWVDWRDMYQKAKNQ